MALNSNLRFSKRFTQLGKGLDDRTIVNPAPKPAGDKSYLRFSKKITRLGAALSKGRSLADIGANGGPLTVMFEGIGRLANGLIDQSFQERKSLVEKTSKAEGWDDAKAAFEHEKAIQLRDQETLAGRVYNESLQVGVFERLDYDIDANIFEAQQKHAANSNAFGADFDKRIAGIKETLPEEWHQQFESETRKRKGRAMRTVAKAELKQISDGMNAEHLRAASKHTADRSASFREAGSLGDMDPLRLEALERANEAHQGQLIAIRGRSDLSPQEKAVEELEADQDMRRDIALGEFEGSLNQGGNAGKQFIDDFEKSKLATDGIEPDARRKLVAGMRKQFDKVSKAGVKSASMRVTDKLMKRDGTLTENLAIARTIEDPETRDAAVARLKTRHAERDTANKAAEKQGVETFWTGFIVKPDIDAIPDDLPSKVRKDALTYAKKRAKDEEPETDWASYDRLMTLEPKQLVGEDLYQHRNSLADKEFRELSKRKARFIEKAGDFDEVGTLSQQLSSSMNSFGWSGNKNGKKRGLFTQRVRQAVNAEQARLGKEIGYDDRQRLIDRMSMEVTVDDGLFYGTDKPAGLLTADDLEKGVSVDIDDIDDDTKTQASAALSHFDIEATDEIISELIAIQRTQGSAGVSAWFRRMGAKPRAVAPEPSEGEKDSGLRNSFPAR